MLNFVLGLLIDKFERTCQRKALLIVGISINVGLLGFFKYAGFFVENLNQLLPLHIPSPNIGLPIGISFFTFESICYIADVYRGQVKATRSFTHMLLYTSFFPDLVAGPIIRFVDIQPQLENRNFTASAFSDGITRFVIGLGKKVIIANQIGESVPILLDGGAGPTSVLAAWFGISLFALQIYYDFSGYTDMAIGLGKMFGFTLKENFNYPYIAKSASDFWRRWNMSLGKFFRDYVYIPLGGNRRYLVRNLFIVWFLTGFWHGAAWNFIIWGMIHGVFMIIERAWLARFLSASWRPVRHIYTLSVVMVAWVFFRAETLPEATKYLSTLFGLAGDKSSTLTVAYMMTNEAWIALLTGLLFATPVYHVITGKLVALRSGRLAGELVFYALPRMSVVVILLTFSLSKIAASTYNPFIYFRF